MHQISLRNAHNYSSIDVSNTRSYDSCECFSQSIHIHYGMNFRSFIMSSYRRFVSYMHHYKNGKKGAGCGFVKIEQRNTACSFFFQLKQLPSSTPFTLAFFLTDKESVTFLPIWSGSCPNGIFSKRFTTDSLHLFNTNYAFRQCHGIVLSVKEEILCGCLWDDQAKIPRRFSLSDASSEQHSSSVGSPTPNLRTPTHIESNALQNSIDKTASDPLPKELSQTASDPLPKELPQTASDLSPRVLPQTTAVPFEELWKQLQKKYPPLDPFEEGGIVEGIKISPSDLPVIESLPLSLNANKFLLHGYKTYKHLLLGRMEGQERYILGIPGVYDSQEEFMAKMFGFPCFKPIRSCKKPIGQFGYWFRCIRA